MQNMFKNKKMKSTEKPYVVNPSIHVVDINMAITRGKVTEEQMFTDKELSKKKCAIDWEKE